jgi:hypothetical protein
MATYRETQMTVEGICGCSVKTCWIADVKDNSVSLFGGRGTANTVIGDYMPVRNDSEPSSSVPCASYR